MGGLAKPSEVGMEVDVEEQDETSALDAVDERAARAKRAADDRAARLAGAIVRVMRAVSHELDEEIHAASIEFYADEEEMPALARPALAKMMAAREAHWILVQAESMFVSFGKDPFAAIARHAKADHHSELFRTVIAGLVPRMIKGMAPGLTDAMPGMAESIAREIEDEATPS